MEPEKENSPQPADTTGHELTVEEVASLFVDAGMPRSPRTIRRYCAKGHLACVLADTELNERYMINRASVENRIAELQSVVTSGHVRTHPDMAGHDRTRPDTTDEDTSGLNVKIVTLEEDNLQLRIDKTAKEHVINQMVKDRREFVAQLTNQAHQIGTLETQLRQLEAPKAHLDEVKREGDNHQAETSRTEI